MRISCSPPERRLALAGRARPVSARPVRQAVEVRRFVERCNRAEASAGRQGTIGGATQAIAEDGGDRYVGGAGPPSRSKQPIIENTLSRKGASAAATSAAPPPPPPTFSHHFFR